MLTRVVPPDHSTYPPVLTGLLVEKGAPQPLFVRGTWPPAAGIAVVGTRDATEPALVLTRSLAGSIVEAGWAVWSGGALGIDAAAHEAAMACGGNTVVVTPSGLDKLYPPEHAELFARVVASGGTLVSPFADDRRPTSGSFHRRNKVLAALTLATVVVQAGEKSGALSTARSARSLGKPLYAVPQAPWDEKGIGCARLLLLGARPITRGRDLVASVRGLSRPRGEPTHAHALQELDEDATRVFEAICDMPIHADDLCDRTALPFGAVAAALLTLTLQAVVVEAPAGFYRRTNH